ncbi:endolytic transglycosylase MltG [Myxococcota bacterium]
MRWAVAAASPIVGAGTAPGGAVVAAILGLSTPRAYAVIPLVVNGRLAALAYLDQGSEPLPLSAASELFAYCDQILESTRRQQRKPGPRWGYRSTSSLPRARGYKTPRLLLDRKTHSGRSPEMESPPPLPPPVQHSDLQPLEFEPKPEQPELHSEPHSDLEQPPHSEPHSDLELQPEQLPPQPQEPVPPQRIAPPPGHPRARRERVEQLIIPEHELTLGDEAVVTPDGVVFGTGKQPQTHLPGRWRKITLALGAGLLVLAGLATIPLAPVSGSDRTIQLVQIPRHTSVPGIAQYLEDQGVISSAFGFRMLARVTGTDRSLRAGAYKLPTGAWTWTVLAELHRGQVHTRTITIPEGLTLMEVAHLLEAEGLARATDVLREAYSSDLLEQHGIPASNVEGYLFPETYTLAKGLSADEILTVMLDEFNARARQIPQAAGLDNTQLFQKVTLASIVEREARDKGELGLVAGVFKNRLERNMRLESCATVQYILGKPKARLTYADVRRQSPYNTYLQPGLPPGPISNPGIDALAAVMAPERHDYLFFFAREDGSHKHIFSETFTAHKSKQRRMRKK